MATAATARASSRERLDQLFKQRIVIFDGSIGVLLQKQGLNEEDWRGERFRDHPKLLKNNVDIPFDELRVGSPVAARALRDGGVDFLLIETIFDTLNSKAAIAAVKEVAPELPLFISVTIVDRSGRNLSGQTVEAFWNSIEHADPFAAGINCSLGATEMRPYIEALSHVSNVYVTCYPNAGLPNSFGGFDEDPPITSRLLREFATSGFLHPAGGCCGTTPDHIRQIRNAVAGIPPRQVPERV